MTSWLDRERQRIEGEKRCSACSVWKPLDDFPRNHRMYLGRSSQCRKCHRAATKDWRERNRERVNAERRAAYRAEHPLPERRCVVCGKPFVRRPDALVCGERCRNRRKREQVKRTRALRDRQVVGSMPLAAAG